MTRIPPLNDGRPVAELRRAVKRYGAVTALAGIDFEVRPSEVVALLGPNGAGKTTAVQLLLGLARASAGEARLFGADPRATEARIRTGAMLQISKVPETLKVSELVDLVSSYYPRPLPRREVMAAAGLEGIEERLFGARGASASACSSPSPSAAIPSSCSWTSRRWGSTSRPGAPSGR